MDAGDAAEMEALFTGLKKKKKKADVPEAAAVESTTETPVDQESTLFSADLKKKKKKKPKKDSNDAAPEEEGAIDTKADAQLTGAETETDRGAKQSVDGPDGDTEYVYKDVRP